MFTYVSHTNQISIRQICQVPWILWGYGTMLLVVSNDGDLCPCLFPSKKWPIHGSSSYVKISAQIGSFFFLWISAHILHTKGRSRYKWLISQWLTKCVFSRIHHHRSWHFWQRKSPRATTPTAWCSTTPPYLVGLAFCSDHDFRVGKKTWHP